MVASTSLPTGCAATNSMNGNASLYGSGERPPFARPAPSAALSSSNLATSTGSGRSPSLVASTGGAATGALVRVRRRRGGGASWLSSARSVSTGSAATLAALAAFGTLATLATLAATLRASLTARRLVGPRTGHGP